MNNMKKGFTLLELLIGITIFAIISGAVYTSLYLGIKVWKNEEKNNSNVQEIMLTFDLLEKSLFSAFINPDDENIKFKGSAEKIEFFAVNKLGQLETVSFYLEPEDSQNLFKLLVLRQKYARKLLEQTEIVPEVVNNRIGAFKLSYFDKGKNKWHSDWPDELSLPDQVKIEIDFKSADKDAAVLHLEKYISIPIANEIQFAAIEETGG